MDDDGVDDSLEATDRDSDSIADDVDYDPTGYFYCEQTGEILTGFVITVTGPAGSQVGVGLSNNINIVQDGSSGYYQFHVTAPGTYTMTYSNANAYPESTTHTVLPPLDVTSLLPSAPASLGSSDDGANHLLDYTSGANPFYLDFNFEAGDPSVLYNNIPFRFCAIADIEITKTDSEIEFTAGIPVVYTITVTNNGPEEATNVLVTDALPAGIIAADMTWDGNGTIGGIGAINDNISTLANGASEIYTVTIDVPSDYSVVTSNADLVNTVSASTLDNPDPDSGNNSATDTNNANPLAELELTKTVNTNPQNVGSNVTFSVSITNNGPSDATGIDNFRSIAFRIYLCE